MNHTKSVRQMLSTDGITNLTYYVYEPLQTPKGMVQISHGMCEYVERYEPIIDYLTGEGYLVFGNDHLGHKNSVANESDLGYFGGTGEGYQFMYRDLIALGEQMKAAYPEMKLFLFGHSMGSFVARAAIINCKNLYSGVIICGTSGSNPALGVGKVVIRIVRTLRGKRGRSALLTKLFFGTYLDKIESVRTPQDWLTRDEQVVDAYIRDKYCMFVFTANGYENLANLLGYVTADSWYDSLDQELPVYLISGEMDPVGGWSKGIHEVDEKLRNKERKDYSMKLYPQMRHEIHNEVGKEEVYQDILNWLNNRI